MILGHLLRKNTAMQKRMHIADSKAARGGDTSRTSSQGRKLASGGNTGKRGDAEIDEQTKSEKTAKKPGRMRRS
jgi:hypothetical protein